MSREATIAPISDWLINCSLGNIDIVELFEDLCKKMDAVGIPIARARLVWPTLHPLFQAETVIWDKGKEAFLDQFEHQDKVSDAWTRSPLRYLTENRLDLFRRQLTGPNELLDFELMKELKEAGFTDYLLLGTQLNGTSFRVREDSSNRGILVSWTSDKPDGFSADDLWALQKIQKRFAVACKTIIQSRISGNIARTYLGDRAGRSVLDGQIRRGDGAKTNAIVWYSDLRNSTSLAESMEPEDYFSLLNSYFMATAEPLVNHGGEILDFIGDAVLGIIPLSEDDDAVEAAEHANDAVVEALQTAADTNQKRLDAGFEKFKFGIGIN
ncbi:MAG: adenylate/guanylate cyclase domain-containing protein, partial [Pseudomonadota bacterium]